MAVVAAVSVLLVVMPAGAEEPRSARIVVLDMPGSAVSAADVAGELAERLETARVEVDVHALEKEPAASSDWTALARRLARERPGTLAMTGWRCDAAGKDCTVWLVEPGEGGIAELPVTREVADDEWAGALAAIIAEAVLGDLLVELHRIASSGEPRPIEEEDAADGDDTPRTAAEGSDPLRVWIEGGYAGEYAHPGGRPIHGPMVGLSLAPSRYVAPTMAVGWLGIRRGEGAAGEAMTHRIPISLAIRLRFEVGPATFAVAPVGRLDTVFSRRDPAGPAGASASVDLEIQVGGITTWHLPFPCGIDAVVGAGVLATVLGEDLEIDGERLVRASDVRLLWMAGLAWDLLAR